MQEATLRIVDEFLAELDTQTIPPRKTDPALVASSYYYARAEALR